MDLAQPSTDLLIHLSALLLSHRYASMLMVDKREDLQPGTSQGQTHGSQSRCTSQGAERGLGSQLVNYLKGCSLMFYCWRLQGFWSSCLKTER